MCWDGYNLDLCGYKVSKEMAEGVAELKILIIIIIIII
jgi:hypothetical protein